MNTKKLIAEMGVNNVPSATSRPSMDVPNRTPNVLTTASFAEKPVMRAVGTLQSLKPRGAKIGASH